MRSILAQMDYAYRVRSWQSKGFHISGPCLCSWDSPCDKGPLLLTWRSWAHLEGKFSTLYVGDHRWECVLTFRVQQVINEITASVSYWPPLFCVHSVLQPVLEMMGPNSCVWSITWRLCWMQTLVFRILPILDLSSRVYRTQSSSSPPQACCFYGEKKGYEYEAKYIPNACQHSSSI